MKAGILRLLPIVAVFAVLAFPATASADNPPTLTITSPPAGTILSGNVTVTVDAQDDVGVDHVIYRFNPGDGNVITLGTSSTPPFTFTFDSTTLPNCGPLSCTLYAQAVDTIGQTSGGSFGIGNSVGVHNAIVVDTQADSTATTGSGCSLRQAIASANDDQPYAGCKSGVAGLTDDIQVPAGFYLLSANFGQLDVPSDMNIVGAGAHSTFISASGTGQRVLEISAGHALVARATIESGNTGSQGPEDNAGVGGGIYVQSGATLNTQNLIVSGNHADTSGGGIDSNGSLFLNSTTIEGNTAGFGGGIDDFGAVVSITNSTITGNQAQTDGGGLFLGGSADTLTDVTIAGNLAGIGGSGSGGGIAGTGNSIHLTNTLLAQDGTPAVGNDCSAGGITSNGNNLADDSSCGLDALGDLPNTDPLLGNLDISGSTDVLPLTLGSPAIDAGTCIGGPSVDQLGIDRPQGAGCDIGAVEFVPPASDYFVSTEQELADALASATANGVAATIHIAAGHYHLGDTTGTAFVRPQEGGPITLDGAGASSTILDGDNAVDGNTNPLDVVDVGGSGTTTIEGLTIQNGTKDGVDDGGDLVLKDSVVRNNASIGVESTNRGLEITGSAISGNGDPNVDFENNGGIYVESPFSAVNTTITGNNGHGVSVDCGASCGGASLNNVTIAGNNGDGLFMFDGISVSDTIIANNTPGGDCTDVQGNLSSNGHNLDRDGSCFSISPGTGDRPEEDPQLGPLQDNGGPTPTMALAAGSPAVDAGDGELCSAVDQRGTARPQGSGCDIGAFELVPQVEAIAFESNRNGSSEIWTMNADGSNPAQLTHDPVGVTDTLPSIAPDGHTIVYQSDASGVNQIWVIAGDGSNPRQLTSQGTNQQPTFSPDGTKIAFDSNRNGNFQLFVMNADGSGQTQITNTNGNVSGSGWSPDGSQIAVSDTSSGSDQIYKVDAGTGAATGPLTSIGENRNPHWSPDGSEILFVSTRCDPFGPAESPTCGGGESVFLMNADGTNQHNLTDAPIFDADPAWSPDGSHVAFVRDLGGQNFNVFTANADGTNQVQLTFGSAPSRNSFPNWGTQVSAATSASASLTTGQSVAMSGSDDLIADIPLSAFEVTPSGVTPAPINGLPINGLPINGLPINGLPINGLPINGLPINGLPINGLPINGLPINGLPINGLPINGLPINGLPINGLELPRTSWEQILAGTPLAGLPLQTITLQQVLDPATYAPQPVPAAVQSLTLGDLELANSSLGQMTIGALMLGSTPINGLGLPADALASLQRWCESVATTSTDCSTLGNYSLFALGIDGAPINGLPINGLPINGLPINGLPINGLPINGLDLSASPINGLPINGLPINGLPINGLPVLLSAVVDCTKVDCNTATLGEAAAHGAIVPRATYGQLLALLLADGSPVQNTLTLGDVIGLLIKRADVPWETLPPRLLSVFDPNRPTLNVSAGFTLQGTGTPSADVKLQIPDGFDFAPGSATLRQGDGDPQPLADPTVDGNTLDWQIPSVNAGVAYTLALELRSGTSVGPAQVTETVTSGNQSDSSVAAFTVDDSYPGSNDPANAPTITPNDGVQMSALAQPGGVDYYRIPMPAAGTRLQVHLTNLPADYDLALYSAQTTSVRTGTATTPAPPLQDGIVSDQPIDLTGGSNGQLPPTALRDLPDPGIPIVQVSANRGREDEDVGMVSPGGGGFVTIAVFGYNGAFSADPYSLRVKAVAPPATQTCAARSFPYAGQGSTPDSLPDLSPSSPLPTNLNTIILVDEKRLGDTYGASQAATGHPGEAEALVALHHLAGDASLGVSGVVVPVEQIPISGGLTVQDLYNQWDANPCNPDAANAVANAIANEVDAIKTARPGVQYVVFGGGDDQIPFFRLPDLSLIANESGFAGQFGPNEYAGSLAAGDLLSDNPYLDTRPIPASGRQLFIPDLVGGRLVETAAEISNAVTSFEGSGGVLRSSTGFVSGYDFVADGSTQVANRLKTLLGQQNVQTLIDTTTPFVPATSWSATDLLNAAFPAAGTPAWINDWNGHYDNTRAEMANGSLLSTGDLTGSHAINGGVFFTMGCHAGFQTSDVVVGSSVLDWPQYFAEHNTGFVGNTGFGLGDSDSVAFSEELMGDFAGNLGGSATLGQALTQAKDQYYLSRVAFSNYDEKTLSEAELYGLPMYGVGSAPASLLAASVQSPDPVGGTTSSTSPSQGSLSSFPGNSVQAASFAAAPHFVGPFHGQDGDYYTNDGRVQAPNYRPLQPYVSLPAARSGLKAHGVVIDSLTSTDDPGTAPTGFDPDNVRPTLDLSANEPEPQFTDEAWPEKIPTLVSLGSDQSLNLITGQFFTETSGSSTTGVERLWTQIGGRVTYSTSDDYTPPTIDSIDAFVSNGVVAFTGRFSDLNATGGPGTVAFAQVVYDDGLGHWTALPLQHDSTSGAWSGGAPFTGDNVQYFVEVCDAVGNCGYSSNKGRYFDARLLPPAPTGSLQITARQPDVADTWYTGSVDVTATSSAPTVSVSVDGGAFAPVSGPVTLSGDGSHIVEASDSDGNTATAVYLIDTTGPAVTHSILPAAPNANGWYRTKPTLTFACTDNLSGVASCPASAMVDENDGTLTVNRTAADNAGNTSQVSVSGIQVDLHGPTNISFSGIQAKLYAFSDLPASRAITCSATDSLSGFDHCDVSGYGDGYGAHTLTATAYDKAGNTSTATLTYTVGLQAGNILAPVAAPSGDQTNPSPVPNDLQVFKIKSTVPLKFQFYLDAAKTTLMTTPPAGSIAYLTVAKYSSSVASTDQTDLVTGSADTGNQFRWTGATAYQYVYNMATSKLAAGTYYCQITLKASDGTVLGQSVPQYFVLRS